MPFGLDPVNFDYDSGLTHVQKTSRFPDAYLSGFAKNYGRLVDAPFRFTFNALNDMYRGITGNTGNSDSSSSSDSGTSGFGSNGSGSSTSPIGEYYSDFWSKLGDYLGFGSAGQQAVWNAKMQDWQNEFNRDMTLYQNDWNLAQWQREADWTSNQQMLQNSWLEQQTSAQNAFNAQEAQKERDWQEYMSNTSYSRAVEDLQRAGLNPILAVGGQMSSGQGASAQAGALGNQALSPTSKQAHSFISNALGANGVAAGVGMSGLSQLTNSALNLFKTGYRYHLLNSGLSSNSVSMLRSGIGKMLVNILKLFR